MVVAATTKKLTDKEKEDLLKEVFGSKYATAGNNLPVLKNLIDKIGHVDNLFTITELLPIVNRILSIRVFSVMASGASIISIFLIPVSAMLNIIDAYQAGRRMYSYRAIAYALTSWAFNKHVHTSSKQILLHAKTGFPRVEAKELTEYDKAWKKSSQDAINKINSVALENNIPKDALKAFMRIIADNNEQKLCDILLKGFEKQFTVIEQKVWTSNYTVRYPN